MAFAILIIIDMDHITNRIAQDRDLILEKWRSRMEIECSSLWQQSAHNSKENAERLFAKLTDVPRENRVFLESSWYDHISEKQRFEEIFQEHQMLREVLFEVLEQERPLLSTERNFIYRTFDQQLIERILNLIKSGSERRQRLEEWMDLAIEAANLGAWTVDLTTQDQLITRTGKYDEIVGLPPHAEHWTPHEWSNNIHPEDRAGVFEIVDRMISGKQEHWDVEYRAVHYDGSMRWIRSWGKCIRDSFGTAIRLSGVVADINEQKLFEQDREQFVESIIHDLKNPLTAAKLRAQLIRRLPCTPEKLTNLSDSISANIDRASTIAQELLMAAWTRSKLNFGLVLEDYHLRTLIEETMKTLIEMHGNRFRVNIEEDFDGVWSRNGIRRIVENLVENAVKHGDPDQLIDLSVKRLDHEVLLGVHNYGDPIPIEVQEVLFKPFKNISEVDESGKRTLGFGLVLVRGMAEAQGGSVFVESTLVGGTTIGVKLPIRKKADLPAAA